MFRIDNDTAAVALPTPAAVGPNPDGYFTDGNPGSAIPATVVDADWANSVQEEISYVVEESGATLDKTDNTQLKVAIDTMIAAAFAGTDLLPPNHINGLALSNGTDTTNDINIAVGKAKASSDDFDITVATAIGKQIDQPWAAGGTTGTPTGGFPSGITLTNDTWYRVFLIAKTDGTVGAGFDTSDTAANLLADATGYTKYRHIGWIRRDTATNRAFHLLNGAVYYDSRINSLSATNPGTSLQTVSVDVPPDARCNALLNCQIRSDSSTTAVNAIFAPTYVTIGTPTESTADISIDAGGDQNASRMEIPVNGSGQITYKLDASGADTEVYINTIGFLFLG